MAERKVRKYGFFVLKDGKWERKFAPLAFPKQEAIRWFQNALLGHFFNGVKAELRPVKDE